MKKKFRIVSVLLTVILLMSAFVTPVAAGRENGRSRGEERGRGSWWEDPMEEKRVIDELNKVVRGAKGKIFLDEDVTL